MTHFLAYAPSPRRRRAFTVVELLVVISILSLILAMLLPVLSRARASAVQTKCASNLRQLGIAFMSYTRANREQFPGGTYDNSSGQHTIPYLYYPGTVIQAYWDWPYYLDPYLSDPQVNDCPTSPDPFPPPHESADGNYGYNENGAFAFNPSLKRIKHPGELMLVMDMGDAYCIEGANTRENLLEDFDLNLTGYNAWARITDERATRHVDDSANLIFMDGHYEPHNLDWLLDFNRGEQFAPYGFFISP